MITIRINDLGLETLMGEIERLSRRAAKLAISPVTARVVGTENIKTELGEIYHMHTVEVSGETVVIAGWQFAATLDNESGIATMIRKAPGFELEVPVRYYDSGTDCDHCRINRQRKDVYLLYSAERGEWKQVGSSCLIDFLGHGNAEAIARYLEEVQNTLGRFDGDEGGEGDGEYFGSGGSNEIALDDFMTYAAALIRTEGYVSGTEARNSWGEKVSTKDQVFALLSDMRYRRKESPVTTADQERAAQVIAWGREYYPAIDMYKRDEYQHNMAITFLSEALTPRMCGFAASGFSAYARIMEIELKRKAKAEASSSEFQGAIKDKLERKVTVTFARELDGNYGVTYLYKMIDSSGNEYTWFSSNSVLDQGDEVRIKGTVKAHETFNGIKQTILTRCKVLQEA